MATELASAYVTLMPSLKGAQASIEAQLSGINLSSVGASMGKSITTGFDVSKVSSALSSLGGTASKAFGAVAKPAAATIGAITTGIAGIAAQGGFARALKIERANTMFKGLKMSTEQIASAMESADIAVTGTAFGLDAAAVAAGLLATSGVALGEDMTRSLQAIAGTAVMAGSDMEDITDVFQKVAAKGKLTGTELTRLAERGVNASGVLCEALGVSGEELADMVKAGEIDFQTFSDAMYDAFGDAAYGANETFSGALANVRNNLSRLGEKFATPLQSSLQQVFAATIPAIKQFSASLDPLVERFTEFSEQAAGIVVPAIETFTTKMEEGAEPTQALSDAVEELGNNLFGEDWEGVKTSISGVATAFALLGATGPSLTLASKALKVFSGPIDKIVGLGQGSIDVFGGLVSGIGKVPGALIQAGSGIVGNVAGIASNLGSAALGFGAQGKEAAGRFLTSLREGFAPGKWQAFLEKIGDLQLDLKWGLEDAKNSLSEHLLAPLSAAKERVSGKFGELASSINNALGGVPGKIAGSLSNFKGVLSESFGNALSVFGGSDGLAQKITGAMGGIGSKLAGVFGTVGEKAKSLAGGALATVGNGLSGLSKAGVGALGGMAKLTVGLGAASVGILGLGVAAARGGVDLQAKAQDMLATVQGVADALPGVAQQLADMLPGLVQQVVDVMPQIIESGTTALHTIVDMLPTLLPLLTTAIADMVNQLVPAIVELMPMLLEAGLQLFIALVDALTQTIPTIIKQLPALITALVDVLSKNGPALLSSGMELFKAIWQALQETLPIILNLMQFGLKELLGYIKEHGPEMLSKAGEFFLNILTALLEKLPDVIRGIGELVGNVIGYVVEHGPEMLSKAGEFIGNLASAIADALPDILSAIGELVLGAIGHIGDFAMDMLNAGKDLIGGLINGLLDNPTIILDTLLGLASDAVNGFLNFFGIASPSKLFAKFGGYTMEGFAKGIEDSAGQAEQAALDAASRTALAAESSFTDTSNIDSGILNAPAWSGVTIEINNPVIRETADVDEILNYANLRLQRVGAAALY